MLSSLAAIAFFEDNNQSRITLNAGGRILPILGMDGIIAIYLIRVK
jgi:hypothetical protein